MLLYSQPQCFFLDGVGHVARKAAWQWPAKVTGRMGPRLAWPGLALCISAFSAPAPLKLSKYWPGAQGRLPRNDPGKGCPPQLAARGSGPCLLSRSPRSFLPSVCLLCFPAAACCGGLAALWTQALEPRILPDSEKQAA